MHLKKLKYQDAMGGTLKAGVFQTANLGAALIFFLSSEWR